MLVVHISDCIVCTLYLCIFVAPAIIPPSPENIMCYWFEKLCFCNLEPEFPDVNHPKVAINYLSNFLYLCKIVTNVIGTLPVCPRVLYMCVVLELTIANLKPSKE